MHINVAYHSFNNSMIAQAWNFNNHIIVQLKINHYVRSTSISLLIIVYVLLILCKFYVCVINFKTDICRF